MLKRYFILILTSILFYGCNKPVKLSKIDKYFDNELTKHKLSKNFEEDSEYGYIRIGNFFNAKKKNAIVISFDSITSLKVYELDNNNWNQIYQQKNANFSRINDLKTYIEDYNFDGIKDIGIRNEVSNGTAIMTFHLWLSEGNTFKYIPDFEEIGNPVIVQKAKIIQGFEACCVFTEITLCDYSWHKNKLSKIRELNISNYSYGIDANVKDLSRKIERKVKLTKKDISEIINKYSENWKLNDTTVNSSFAL